MLAQKMGEKLGQQIVVENVGGAGGTIGVNKVAKATLEPIGLGGTNPMVLVVKKDLPAKTFAEFMAYVKANQKKAQYGMAGIGSAPHLGGLMLNSMMKIDVLEIPYKGTAPALNDLLSGQFDYMVDQAIDGSGLPGYEVTIWNGDSSHPRAVPADVITKVNKASPR